MLVKIDSGEGIRYTSTVTKQQAKVMATNFQVLGDTDKTIKTLAQRDAIVALYQGHITASQVVSTYPGASRQRSVELSHRLPKGLLENADHMQLTRAVNKLLKIGCKYGTYTSWELQEAIIQVETKKMKPGQASFMFGVPPTTLLKKRKALTKMAGVSPEPKQAANMKAVKTIKKKSPGPRPYLLLDEEEILLGVADQVAAEGLPGRDFKRLGSEGRSLCRKLAPEGEPNEKTRKRLLSAKCDWRWATRLLNNHENTVVAAGGTMKKQSQLSAGRARAKNPTINAEMFKPIAGC